MPSPTTSEVTSYSTQEFAAKSNLLSAAPLIKAGRLFQLIPPVPDSTQLLFARYTAGPFVVPFVVQKTRSLTFWMADPVAPLTVKRT